VSDQESPLSAAPAQPSAPAVTPVAAVAAPVSEGLSTLQLAVMGGLSALSLAALALAWQSQSRAHALEEELVRRQAQSQGEAQEARNVAKQSQDLTRDTAAKVALLDARLAEVALQRGQLEELMQSMSRSRDENVLGDLDSALRVALQQTSITGSAEPLVAALKQADERLQRYKQPRLDGVRRAVARDLDRVKAVSVVDVATLSIKLDEVSRLVDELPLLSVAERDPEANSPARMPHSSRAARAEAPGKPASSPEGWEAWVQQARQQWDSVSSQAWQEAKSLLRVTRIKSPEAALLAPEQSFFLRENLKLRLLNARLALLSRQFETSQTDLREALGVLDRYFDGRSRKVQVAVDLLRQVSGQARQVTVPRPDDTLAALSAAGR